MLSFSLCAEALAAHVMIQIKQATRSAIFWANSNPSIRLIVQVPVRQIFGDAEITQGRKFVVSHYRSEVLRFDVLLAAGGHDELLHERWQFGGARAAFADDSRA